MSSPIQPKGVGIARIFRWLWGILTLLSCGWIIYGLTATGAAFSQVVTQATVTPAIIANSLGTPVATTNPSFASAGTAIGATIGSGLGVAFFLCSGIPLLLIFGFLYWRNGVAIRSAREHAQMVNAVRDSK